MDDEVCRCFKWWKSCGDVVWKSPELDTKALRSIPGSVMWHWANQSLEIGLFVCKIGIMTVLWLIVWIRLNWASESACPRIETCRSLWRNLPAPLFEQHPDLPRHWRENLAGVFVFTAPTLVLWFSIHPMLLPLTPWERLIAQLMPWRAFNKTLVQFGNG